MRPAGPESDTRVILSVESAPPTVVPPGHLWRKPGPLCGILSGRRATSVVIMTKPRDRPARSGRYIAATTQELITAGFAKRMAAVINQRVLFGHRGHAELLPRRLVLHTWTEADDLEVDADDVTAIDRKFTHQYGRFLGGGSAEWGAPVIIREESGREIYLLFDHRALLEKSSNVEWHLDLLAWWERSSHA